MDFEESFQAGCNEIEQALAAKGIDPAGKSPEELAKAIGGMSTSNVLLFTDNPANIAKALPDIYTQLTKDDFIVGATGARGVSLVRYDTGGGMKGMTGDATTTVQFSYNPGTGILNMSHGSSNNYESNPVAGATVYTQGSLFAVYKGTIAGKAPNS